MLLNYSFVLNVEWYKLLILIMVLRRESIDKTNILMIAELLRV